MHSHWSAHIASLIATDALIGSRNPRQQWLHIIEPKLAAHSPKDCFRRLVDGFVNVSAGRRCQQRIDGLQLDLDGAKPGCRIVRLAVDDSYRDGSNSGGKCAKRPDDSRTGV